MVAWACFTHGAFAPNQSAVVSPLASRLVGPQSCSESSNRIFSIDQIVDVKIQCEIMKFKSSYKIERVVRRSEGGVVLTFWRRNYFFNFSTHCI